MMGITQHDRDRIEDLGLDPEADHTEDLRQNNAADTADLGGTGVDGRINSH